MEKIKNRVVPCAVAPRFRATRNDLSSFLSIFSVIGVMVFLSSDVDGKWKMLAATMVVVSVGLQFGLADHVHFLVPLAIQLVICGWMALFWQIN